MRKGYWKKCLAGALSLAMVVSAGNVSIPGAVKTAAAKEFTKADGTKVEYLDNGSVRKELSSQDLVDYELGVGINIGNTFEAVLPIEQKKDATEFESAWDAAEEGGTKHKVTREYVDYLHSFGFNTVRIPVAWSNGDIDDGTYTIRPELLDRVEEVVNYCLDNGMYVVINDHWDNQWWGEFGACKYDDNGKKVADEDMRAEAWKRYERYWTQISERFKDYSDHLIFEGANEELGARLNDEICLNGPAKGYCKPNNAGNDIKTLGGNLKNAELYETTNQINQKFVDVVRSTGGNNAYRFLLIPGYSTDITSTKNSKYVMPTDPAEAETGVKKLLLSVHFYSPTDFCLDGGGGYYSNLNQEANKKELAGLQRFSDEGYGTIIGECGVCEPSNVTGSVTQWFYDTFLEAQNYHACPVLWETGAIFDRTKVQIIYKDLADFYNTINRTDGQYTTTLDTGGTLDLSAVQRKVPDYLDAELWDMDDLETRTPAIRAYMFYQTATWAYRDAYKPWRTLGAPNKHSWEFVTQKSGSEVSAETTTVTDVKLTGDGTYTLKIDGIDLSSANSYQMLGISTDIRYNEKAEKNPYPGIKVSDVSLTVDGKLVQDGMKGVEKTDQNYYTFMLINTYDNKQTLPLNAQNEEIDKFAMPEKSMEITFTISGLDKVLGEIADGTYVDPEIGSAEEQEDNEDFIILEKILRAEDLTGLVENWNDASNIDGKEDRPVARLLEKDLVPPAETAAAAPATTAAVAASEPAVAATPSGLAVGKKFNSGSYTYKVKKAAKNGKNGTVSIAGLTSKGKKAKTLTMGNTVKGTDGNTYTISALESKAFKGAKAKSITLNKNIKKLPALTFQNCKNLAKLTFKAKLTSVTKNAFNGCKKKIKVAGTGKAANKKKLKKTSYKKFK